MDINRKKRLLEEYRNRRPEMGVISFRCKYTGERFLGFSMDTKADFNSNRFKLSAKGHPNKLLQNLWDEYGESGFELSVIEILEYDSPDDDHSRKLATLLALCFANDPKARRIWR